MSYGHNYTLLFFIYNTIKEVLMNTVEIPDTVVKKEDKTANLNIDEEAKYQKEGYANDLIATRFMNIAKYVEDIQSDNPNNPDASWVDALLTNYDVSKINNTRLQFYSEFMKVVKKDPRIMKKILNVYNDMKQRKKKERVVMKRILSLMKKYKDKKSDQNYQQILNDIFHKNANMFKYYSNSPRNQQDNNAQQTNNTTSKSLESVATGEPITPTDPIRRGGNYMSKYINDVSPDDFEKMREKLKQDETEDNLRGELLFKYDLDNLENLKQNITDNNIPESVKKSPIQKFIDDYYVAVNDKTENKTKKLKKAIYELEDSPQDVLKTLKISREDRLIFIITTFVIRYMTINLVQWCIDINFIKDFYQGFVLYAIIYCAFFWLIVMFVNVNTLPVATYMHLKSNIGSIRSLFYYFYMETNGITRLLTHTAIIIIMLLIPFIVNIGYKKDTDKPEFLPYEDKKKLIKTLSLLTIFLWILTTIVAIKF